MEENKNNAVEKVEQVANQNLTGNGINDPDVLSTDNLYQTDAISGEPQPHGAQKRGVWEDAGKVFESKSKEELKAEAQRKKEIKRVNKLKNKAQHLREKHLKEEQREQNKKAKKLEKSRLKNQDGSNGNGRKMSGEKKGWITAIVSLGIATLVLASAMTYMLIMPSASDKALESAYRRSFYDTVEQVDNIDLNLSKALSTKDSSALMKYLTNTAINSEVAENDIQSLPLQDENKFYTTKLINQIGDYSKYLNNKLAKGEQLTSEDYKGLSQLYKANLEFKNSLQLMMNNMGEDFNFSSMQEGGRGNVVIGNFNDLQNLSVEYPELIYDGPFSDGQTEREIKGLKGEEITAKRAKDIFLSIFSSYQIDSVENSGETGGKIDCYNISASTEGDLIYGQVSKIGGKLIMFSYAGKCNAVNYDEDYAQQKAIEFLNKTGTPNMKPVWINLANNVYTINCAYEQNGIIVYADLIKVRVCADSGNVIGLEASGYYTNHTDRVIGQAVLSERQALSYVSENVAVQTARLVLVPEGQNAERLCYEFSGTSEGRTYYVYIDSVTGRQVEMFKVIESTEGTLLM